VYSYFVFINVRRREEGNEVGERERERNEWI